MKELSMTYLKQVGLIRSGVVCWRGAAAEGVRQQEAQVRDEGGA